MYGSGLAITTGISTTYSMRPSSNVLAITPTLSFTKRTAYDDKMRLPGEIVDAEYETVHTAADHATSPADGAEDLI